MYIPKKVTCLKQIIVKPVVHNVNYLHGLEPLLDLAVVIIFHMFIIYKTLSYYYYMESGLIENLKL